MWRLVGWLSAIIFTASVAGDDCVPVHIRSSPARVAWRLPHVSDVRVGDDSIVAGTKEWLQKLEPNSGKAIWTHPLKEEYVPQFVLLPGRVAVVRQDRYVVLLNSADGIELKRTDAGEWIRFLAGPPLLAITQATDAATSELIRLSTNGAIVAQRTVPRATDVSVIGDVGVVEHERGIADPELETVTAYELVTLQPLWSEKSFTFNKQVVGNLLYLGDIFWSTGAKAIDPATGVVDRVVPTREPFKVGGSKDFDLQVVSTAWTGAWSPDYAACEGLRRNYATTAKVLWRTDVPFRVSATLRDGERLYVAGSRDSSNRFLVALNWRTGDVEASWSGVPKLSRLQKVGDLILGYDLGAELVAFRISDR